MEEKHIISFAKILASGCGFQKPGGRSDKLMKKLEKNSFDYL